MRMLVVGAGALGGYFGGRLLEAGNDITFLVRSGRAAQLQKTGLVIKSRFGDITLPQPPYLQADMIHTPFGVVTVGCKAYDLEAAMTAFAPAVGASTVILPLLNGLKHIDDLARRFGRARVLGGVCVISATLDADGHILHLNDTHSLSFGELDGPSSQRVMALEMACSRAKFDGHSSISILQEMWEKWVFIAATAGVTCLMRAPVGDIVVAGGAEVALGVLEECANIAASNGFAPRARTMIRAKQVLTAPDSLLAASMLKDIERGAPIEADHIVGDLLLRNQAGTDTALLHMVYAHLKSYEVRRARQQMLHG